MRGANCAIKAWYKPGEGIFLDESLKPETNMFDRSILLHEMVHYFQDMAGYYGRVEGCDRWFHRELNAYEIQNRYLGTIGHPSRVAYAGNNCPRHGRCRPGRHHPPASLQRRRAQLGYGRLKASSSAQKRNAPRKGRFSLAHMLFQSPACSNGVGGACRSSVRRNACRSASARPGSPSIMPQGTVMAGWWVMSNGAVLPIISSARCTYKLARCVGRGQRGGLHRQRGHQQQVVVLPAPHRRLRLAAA